MSYKRYEQIKESKSIFPQALGMWQSFHKDEEKDIRATSKMTTSAEKQRYKRKFDKNTFEMNVNGFFRKLKSMEGELPKAFISKMIKIWNKGDAKSMLSAEGNLGDIKKMIYITQQIIEKLK